MSAQVTRKIKEIVETTLSTKLKKESELLDQGILDSLMTIQLITNLENHYDLTIPTDEFTHHNFNSIQLISDLILRLSKDQNGAFQK